MPYQRDALARRAMVVETFETACTWDRFAALHAAVTAAAQEAAERVCGAAVVTCRFTHVYPDGPAPYYGVYAPGPLGLRWSSSGTRSRRRSRDAIVDHGGTITHHHAVGPRPPPLVRPRSAPTPFAAALAAAKSALDPAGVLNPGVLLDADRRGRLEA